MEKLTMTRKEAAASIGVGLNLLDRFIKRKDDPLPSFAVGKRVLIPIDQLKEWIARQAKK